MLENKTSWMGFIVLSICIVAWYFHGFDISQLDYNDIFANVDSIEKQFLILIIYVLWMLILTHEYSQNKVEFQYFYFSALIVFLFTTTLVLPMIFPYDRKDFILSSFTGALSGYFLVAIRTDIEILLLSFKIKSPILKWHITTLFFAVIFVFILYAILFFYSDIFLFVNTILFLLSILSIFLFNTPKKVLFSEIHKRKLNDLSNAINYKQELNDLGFDEKVVFTQKEALSKIQDDMQTKANNILMRFKIINQINFLFDEDNKFMKSMSPEKYQQEDIIALVEFYNQNTGEIFKKINVTFKYLLLAFDDMKVHMSDSKLVNHYITLLIQKALEYIYVDTENPQNALFRVINLNNLTLLNYFFNQKNINLNYVDLETGYTPLLFSVVQSSKEITAILLEKGANPEIGNKLGIKPLNFAARYGKLEDCKLLLSYGTDINQTDTLYNYTPLMNATMYGHIDVVDFLLSNGADPDKIDSLQKKAIDYAQEKGYGKIAAMLRKASK